MHRSFLLVLIACSAPPRPVATSNRATPTATVGDRDRDWIADDQDRCPSRAEDYDAFADDDGCPDLDNDGDGAPDDTDDCPYDAGANRGCVKPCHVFVHDSEDCFLDPTVFYNERDVPQQARIDEIVRLVRANPSVQGLEVLGTRADLVAGPLRARLPALEIDEVPGDIGRARAIYVRFTKQRFGEGRFRTMECTPFGAIYRPARPGNCTR